MNMQATTQQRNKLIMAKKLKPKQAAVRINAALLWSLRRLATDKQTTAKALTERALLRTYPQLQTDDGAAA